MNAALTRPCSEGGEYRWVAVVAAATSQTRPMPSAAAPARHSASEWLR